MTAKRVDGASPFLVDERDGTISVVLASGLPHDLPDRLAALVNEVAVLRLWIQDIAEDARAAVDQVNATERDACRISFEAYTVVEEATGLGPFLNVWAQLGDWVAYGLGEADRPKDAER